jgi:AcrR family transcriptional regulator
VTLRDRKRARTRRDLVAAALELFERDGFERTTVADIATFAEVGTRTFFSYFGSKAQVLFPDAEARVTRAVAALAGRPRNEELVESVLCALRAGAAVDDDMPVALDRLRVHFIRTVPLVRREALLIQFDAQCRIGRRLVEVFPDRVGPVAARALAGGVIGAFLSAVQVLLDRPDGPDGAFCIEQAFGAARAALPAVWPSS